MGPGEDEQGFSEQIGDISGSDTGYPDQDYDSAEYGSGDDGGLPPGGAPEQQTCDCGPCPNCMDEHQMSSPCIYQLGHEGEHQCNSGHLWMQNGPSDVPQREKCGGPCPKCGKGCIKDRVHGGVHWCGQHEWGAFD
jgi:hypothetical protein